MGWAYSWSAEPPSSADCCPPCGGLACLLSAVHMLWLWLGPQAVWRDASHTHLLGLQRWVDAAASPATAPWELGGRPRRGPRKRGGARRRAPWQLTIKLVDPIPISLKIVELLQIAENVPHKMCHSGACTA